ncbi:MAG: DUF255 domain-containing protein [Crocinitomicaceae bacterium]|nr:DUF255 domain-containing protein [Crocinitomicaceae bacterium]
MKALTLTLTVFLSLTLYSRELNSCPYLVLDDQDEEITWYDFESAIDECEKKKKPIFIDVYTDWCGWCKKMDNSTFKNPQVVEFMNENFYAVKMDAESKEPIAYKEKLYEYKTFSGGKGYNELAVNLLGSQMSFPSFVILSKRQVKVGIIRGYQKPKELISKLEKYS